MSLSFAGVSSDSVNVVVERYPVRPIPARKIQTQEIPGRNGDLLFDENAYANVDQTYEIYVRHTLGSNFQQSCIKAAEWLLTPVGYQRLTDSYDPSVFRLAYFSGPVDVSNALNQLGRTTITFSCKPFRYLVAGADAVTITGATTLANPTGIPAAPTIIVYGSGAGTIGIGDYTVAISDIDNGMTIDCDLMDCYNGGNNRCNLLTLSPTYQYPQLVSGNNSITIGGGVTSLSLTPNWRTL